MEKEKKSEKKESKNWAEKLAEKETKLAKSISGNFINIAKMLPDFSKIIPKINVSDMLPNLNLKPIKIPPIENPLVAIEKNNWQRHNEIMEIQDGILKVNNSILKEQSSTSKLTKWILGLTIAILVIAIVGLIIRFS